MNGPDLEKPVQETVEHARRSLEKVGEHSRHSEDRIRRQNPHKVKPPGRFQPKRWWFTSTAFPLIAGTFGPLANLMSVCALVQTWRVKFKEDNGEVDERRISDPTWLLALNGVSLVFAVGANVLLLLNFAQRVRYRIAQPITVIFWFIASIILITLVIASAQTLPLYSDDYAFSQSFYYGLISAVLYFIIASLLTLNILGSVYFHAYPASLETLTMPQRTLMLQTTFYAFYLALGAGIFSSIENWNYVDGIYFSHYTLLTIGLGSDFPLYQTSARILLIPYAFLGVIFLGLIISSIRSLFLSRAKQKVRLRALDQERTRLRKKRNSCPEHNFQLMRRTQNAADRSRKYWGLTSSATATLSLWLFGALVFYFSERHRPQHWSYWNAIYFSYTTLLTIGYGDFFPVSMSGKPFFVVWSMLAVPTMTIFISTMGDTVVGWVKKATFWISRRTILPEKHGEEDEKSGNVDDDEDIRTDDGVHIVRLAREIKRVAADVGSTPPKRYEWDRWQMWLGLLGVNEEEAEWSWLGDEGPLMSGVTETVWVLEKLCAQLEEIAKAERKGK